MPAINYAQKLFDANASAATDWGAVEGGAESEVAAGASLKRGFRVEAGLSALVELDGELAKFIAAQVTGRAEASARVTAQVQLPLNLFDEAGAAIRLQAVAEAAAGVQASLGLSVGDFIELARGVLGGDGVPLRLFTLFVEEIELKAGVYAKVAASAQAQAYAAIVGTLSTDAARGLKPGFNIVAGAGLGLAAGAGVRLFARAQFRDFPRFYARAVDVAVDGVFDEARQRLGGAAGPAITAALDAARPPLKIAFRLAYDIGEYIAAENPPASSAGAAQLASRCLAVIFEEGQRHLLRSFFGAATKDLRAQLGARLRSLDAAGRARVKPRRDALIARLRSRPADPFDLSSPAAQDFWNGVVDAASALAIDAYAGAGLPVGVQRGLAVAWCAAQMLLVATRRATRADASLRVVGQVPNAVRAAFTGAPDTQPPQAVSDALAAILGTARPSSGWRLDHAVGFLASAPTVALLEAAAPQIRPFLEAFRGVLGTSTTAVAQAMLGNLGAVPDAAGAVDAQQTLRRLVAALQVLCTDVLDAQAMPALRTALADSPQALLYLNDVLRPGANFALGACTDLLLGWSDGQVTPGVATEALSAVILKLLGRTLVVTADILQDEVQHGTQGLLEEVAQAVTRNGMAAKFAQITGLPADTAAARAADFLRLVGRTLQPYTPAERSEMRSLFYAALDPLPAAAGRDFIDELARDSFVPNALVAERLVQRSFDLLSERFVAFALGSFELFGQAFLTLIEDALAAAGEAVRAWLLAADAALSEAERVLAELGLQILAAADAAAQALDRALGDLAEALGAIGSSARRSVIRTRLADAFVDQLEGVLDDNPVYRAIPPSFRAAAKAEARTVVRGLANGVAGSVFDAIAAAADEAEEWLDDIRELDPSTGLASGVADLMLDRIEQAVRDALGQDDPGFDVAFSFSYQLPELVVSFRGARLTMKTHRLNINLGRVELPISRLLGVLREVIRTTSGFESAIGRAAGQLRVWLEKELQAAALRTEQSQLGTEARTLRDDRTAVAGAPRDLTLASPAPGSVHRGPVAVRVVLGGALAGFTDNARGPQRVLVYLNGEQIPFGRFTADPPSIVTAGIATNHAGLVASLPALAAAGEQIRPQGPAQRMPSASRSALRAAVAVPARMRAVGSRSGSGFSAVALPTALGMAAVGGRGKPGSAISGGEFERWLAGSAPRDTVVLRATLDLSDCLDGLNLLSVSTVGPGGARLTCSATFAVVAPQVVRPKPDAPPVVFPPRLQPVDPAKLRPKPKPKPASDSLAAHTAKAAAARSAIVTAAAALNPAVRLQSVSPLVKARLAASLRVAGETPGAASSPASASPTATATATEIRLPVPGPTK